MNLWKTTLYHDKVKYIAILAFSYLLISGWFWNSKNLDYLEPVAAIGLCWWAITKDNHERKTDSACFGALMLWAIFYIGSLIQVHYSIP